MKTKGLFITGTDTSVGKTYLSCCIIREMIQRELSVGAYKPVCSGVSNNHLGENVWGDVELLHAAIKEKGSKKQVCPQTFLAAMAPDRAAKLEAREVNETLIKSGWQSWEEKVDYLLVEGVGGILSPVSEQSLVADLAVQMRYPLLIVSHAGLGTINQTLLTIEAAQKRGLSIVGIVFNHTTVEVDCSRKFNVEDLCARTEVPILGVMLNDGNALVDDSGKKVVIDWASHFA